MMRSRRPLAAIGLHEAVDLEPVRSPAISGARLGHPDHEALPESAGLARGPVLLVHHAPELVLALGDH